MSDDITLTEQFIDKVADSPEQAVAVKRVLGVERQAVQAAQAWAPELPPEPQYVPVIDHLAHARSAVTRYAAWVDSHPDDDPTPRGERERTLRLARLDLQRLEAR